MERVPGAHRSTGDRQTFDEVRIVTLPRFKDSPVSGSQWRTSARTELLYKGRVVFTATFSDVDAAMRQLECTRQAAFDHLMSDAYTTDPRLLCDQEGCAVEATVTYSMRATYCCDAMHATPCDAADVWLRSFCARHSTRGQGYYDDTDDNYVRVAGDAPSAPLADDVVGTSRVLVYADAVVSE